MNDRIASILMRGQIPVMEQEQPVQEAAPEQHTQQNYVESKPNTQMSSSFVGLSA